MICSRCEAATVVASTQCVGARVARARRARALGVAGVADAAARRRAHLRSARRRHQRAHSVQADARRRRRHGPIRASRATTSAARKAKAPSSRTTAAPSLSGVGVVHVPVGTYDVYVSRGPEWDFCAIERKVRIAGRQIERGARCASKHVVDTSGWLSARFSRARVAPRPTRTCPCTIASTSSSPTASSSSSRPITTSSPNYAPMIAELGAGRYIASVVGDELTTQRLGTLRRLPAAARSRARGPAARCSCTARNAERLLRRRARASRPTRSSTCTTRASTTRSATSTSASFDAQHDRADARRASRSTSTRSRCSTATRTPSAAAVDRSDRRLVRAARPRAPRHRDGQLRHAPPRPTTSAAIRATTSASQEDQPAVAARPLEIRARRQRAPRRSSPPGRFVALTVGSAGIGDVAPAPRRRRQGRDRGARRAVGQRCRRATLYVDGHEAHRWKVDEERPMSCASTRRFDAARGARRLAWSCASTATSRWRRSSAIASASTVRPLALTNPVFLDVDGNGKYDPPEKHGAHDVARPPDARPR